MQKRPPKEILNDVTTSGEELKSEPETSLDHAAKVDKQAEEAVAEAPVAVKEAVETEPAPETQDAITAAAGPAADETPAPEPEATGEEVPKIETVEEAAAQVKEVLPESAETAVAAQEAEEQNTTVEAELPETSTSEAVATASVASPEVPKDTEERTGTSTDEEATDKPAPTEAVTDDLKEKTTVTEDVPEPSANVPEETTDKEAHSVSNDEPEVTTNEDVVTKEAITDEQSARTTTQISEGEPNADLPDVPADSLNEAGLQGKLQLTEARPEIVMDNNKVEANEEMEPVVNESKGHEDAPKTNGGTTAAVLGAAAVIPGAAFLAKKALESKEAPGNKTAPDGTSGTIEQPVTKKDVAGNSERVNDVTVQDESKFVTSDEFSKDTKTEPVPGESAAAEGTSKTVVIGENDKDVAVENTSSPESQVKESPPGKADAQEAVNGKAITDDEPNKVTHEASKSTEEPSSSAAAADADASAVVATTNGTKTNGTKTNGTKTNGMKTNGASEETRPPTGNKSVSSLTAQRRDNFLKALWRAIFVNFFGSLFGFRRRDATV